jgi:SAM-dependent methyltransferase
VSASFRKQLPSRLDPVLLRLRGSWAQRLVDPNWHRRAVGGRWEEMGRLQFDYLVAQGLEPSHAMLDVGCGSLRGGIHFIRYLDAGKYTGVDINPRLIDAGKRELRAAGLDAKRARLLVTRGFDFEKAGPTFDYALAQSVFTHIPLNDVTRCLVNVAKVLNSGGRFYATVHLDPRGKNGVSDLDHERPDGSILATHYDRDPFHYALETLEWACEGTGLKVSCLGDWGHPHGQKMLLFEHAA